jgi:hypothetical protein
MARLAMPTNQKGEGVADVTRAKSVMSALCKLLASDDTEAGNLFESHRELLLATLGAAASTAERQLASFDYPGALQTLRAAQQQPSG